MHSRIGATPKSNEFFDIVRPSDTADWMKWRVRP